ncbi:hypothetical protein ACU3L3_14410 [Priestia endophytica]
MSILLRAYGKTPHALILDTNILINLLSPSEYDNKDFLTLTMGSTFFGEIIIPQQVLDEWNYQKDKIDAIHYGSIDKNVSEINKFINKLPSKSGKDETDLMLKNLSKLARRSYEYNYAIRKQQIDDLIRREATIIETRNRYIDKSVIDFFIKKDSRPFFTTEGKSGKNEASDALIFFGIVDFMNKHRKDYEKAIFVSSNTNEFSERGNPTKLHSNLEDYFSELDIEFTNNLRSAFKYFELDKSKHQMDMDLFKSAKENEVYLTDDYFIPCQNKDCDNEVHINMDTWVKYNKYYYICRKCKHTWDSGDSIEDSLY